VSLEYTRILKNSQQKQETQAKKDIRLISVLPSFIAILVVLTIPAYLFGLVFGLVSQFYLLQEHVITIANASHWYVFECEVVSILAYYVIIGLYFGITVFLAVRKKRSTKQPI
jgi:hypothetical protein